MKKVFILKYTDNDNGGEKYLGVYSSREKAINRILKEEKKHCSTKEDFEEIKKYDLEILKDNDIVEADDDWYEIFATKAY